MNITLVHTAEFYNNPTPQTKSLLVALQDYLQGSVEGFVQCLDSAKVQSYDNHADFKGLLVINLKTTPWGNAIPQWREIFQEKSPFSQNITLDNYIPNPWMDDNVYFKQEVADCRREVVNPDKNDDEEIPRNLTWDSEKYDTLRQTPSNSNFNPNPNTTMNTNMFMHPNLNMNTNMFMDTKIYTNANTNGNIFKF